MGKIYSKSLLAISSILMLNFNYANAITNLDMINNVDAYKSLDMSFDNNSNTNSVNNRTYKSSNTNGKYGSSLKGNGYEANNSKIHIPFSDLNIDSNQNILTVSFLFKWDGEDNVMPISINGTTPYSLWIRDGCFGFNTGNSEIYGIKIPFAGNKFYSVVAEFNFTDIKKSNLYIDGVKQTLSYVKGSTSVVSKVAATGGINIAGAKSSDTYNIKKKSIIDEVKLYKKALTTQEVTAVSKSHETPLLYSQVINNKYVKLDWSTEILPENLLWNVGYEANEQANVDLVYNKNNGLGDGGQSFSTNAYTGSYSLYTPKTRPDKGNWVLYPYTVPSVNNHVYYRNNEIVFGNDDYISISYRIKSNYDLKVSILGDWKYEKKLTYHNAYLTKAAKKGDTILYVSDTKWYNDYKNQANLSSITISFDTVDGDINDNKQYRVTSVNSANNTVEISMGLREDVSSGFQLRSRKSMWAFNDSVKSITCNGEWKLVNFNTPLNQSPYINWSEYGISLRQGWATYGDAYIDDLKVGYATKVRLYRDGTKIYEGHNSELSDEAATDKNAPSEVSNIKVNVTKNENALSSLIDVTYDNASDNGTTYRYNISAIDKAGKETPVSASKNITVVSGIKGYSYIIDKIPTTIPDNVIETTSNKFSYKINDNSGGVYYLHIKAIDNSGNVSSVVHKKIDIPTLTATPNVDKNMISLNWTMDDIKNKTFKVYQKKPGSTVFQSISSTNLNSSKQVKVLNIYPDDGDFISFNTWDGENVTVRTAGSLKKWMEEPNSESSKGYGQGVIEVTPVSLPSFNSNPGYYLNKINNKWNYDVIMVGSWDANAMQDISAVGVNVVKQFIGDGGGLLLGHDTVGYLDELSNLRTLAPYLNMNPTGGKHFNGYNEEGGAYDGSTLRSNICITKKGLLTNYPWVVGDVGTNLSVPITHSLNQLAYGDIWMRFDYNKIGFDNPSNFYLTTWNNTAMIQTGHSKGTATPDEQKLLANTLFYLNQLSSDTYLDDYSGQDVDVPEVPIVNLLKSTSTQLKFNFDGSKDIGSEYSYYVVAEDKNGNSTYQSNTVKATVTSGIKGFSYVLDTSPTTNPDNTIDHINGDLTINNVKTGTKYYLHVKAIDNAGNIGNTRHFVIDTSKPKSPVLTLNRTGWGTDNVSFKLTQQHNKNLKIISISNTSKKHYIDKLKSYGYNIVESPNCTNINEMLKYDVVILDADCFKVDNEETLEALYNKGCKIITVGNDTTNSIYPILSTIKVGEVGFRTNRVVKNEATYDLPTYGGGFDYNAQMIKSLVGEANVLYSFEYDNSPALIEVKNAQGGRWIHSQKILGINCEENADEFLMGLLDYITDSISQVHVNDVQYKINNGEWISYNGGNIPITKEGLHTVSIRNVDNRGVASDIVTKTVGIDRTAPFFTAKVPAVTESRNVIVSITGMGDSLSGIKNIRLSNYSDFRDSTGYISVAGETSLSTTITMPFYTDANKNYSTRTIYVQLFDNVGNSKIITCSTKYEAKAPDIPVITSPKQNVLYADGAKVNISWTFKNTSEDGIDVPQHKANIKVINTITKKTYSYVINGTDVNYQLSDLEDGIYTVTVEVFNSFGKSTTSNPVTFRYNYRESNGYVLTKNISVGTGLRYVNVVTSAEIPKNTKIEGYIYYAKSSKDAFTDAKKIKFSITGSLKDKNTIMLPEKSEKVMIRYNLYNESGKPNITPALDDIIVYGK